MDVPIDENGVAPRYLRIDLSVSCNTMNYQFGYWFAIFMSVIYPFGLTVLYAWLLYRARYLIQHRPDPGDDSLMELCDATEDLLDIYATGGEKNKLITEKKRAKRESEYERMWKNVDSTHHTAVLLRRMNGPQGGNPHLVAYEDARKKFGHVRSVGDFEFELTHFFYESYRPHLWYWELVEVSRRIIMCAFLSIVMRGTREQILVGLSLSVFFFALHCQVLPYTDKLTNNLAKMGHFQHMLTMFIALLVRNRAHMRNDEHFFLPSYDALLCLVNFFVAIAFTYLILRRELRHRLLQLAESYGVTSIVNLLFQERKIKIVDHHSDGPKLNKKRSKRALTRRLNNEFDYGPAFTNQFTGDELREDMKGYFFYLKATIAHVYTYVLHERRTTHNITNRGFYAESSEEEDSEPEFVSETEETWLDNIGKTADFLDNHVLFTSEDVVSCFNDPGVATSMLTEIAHEVESEYTEYIFTIDIQEEIEALAKEVMDELTPPPDTVIKRALAGSVLASLLQSEEAEVTRTLDDDMSDSSVLASLLHSEVDDEEAEVTRKLDYDMSDSSEEDEETLEDRMHEMTQKELDMMRQEDDYSKYHHKELLTNAEKKAARLAAKKERIRHDKKVARDH